MSDRIRAYGFFFELVLFLAVTFFLVVVFFADARLFEVALAML